MPGTIEKSHPAIEVLTDGIPFVDYEDSAREGVSTRMSLALLFLVGIGFFLIGFLLVFLGSAGPASSGGCFFWPFPVIVVCGVGTGGGSFLLTAVFAAILISLIVLLASWMGKSDAQGSPTAVPS